MQQLVSITSKNQVTLPVKIARLLNINRGDKFIIRVDSGKIIMEKAQELLDELAGSLIAPKKYKNKPISFIIKEAKKEYFTKGK